MPKKRKSAPAESGNKKKAVEKTASEKQPKERPMLRAIRVTPEMLDAAKEYKKATGKSFYALGLEAITERLVKEGYLKEPKA